MSTNCFTSRRENLSLRPEIGYGTVVVRIGINVSRLSGQRLGAGRHVEYMLNSFEITKPLVDNEFIAVWPNYIRSAIKLCSLFKISHEKQNRRAGVPELSRLP